MHLFLNWHIKNRSRVGRYGDGFVPAKKRLKEKTDNLLNENYINYLSLPSLPEHYYSPRNIKTSGLIYPTIMRKSTRTNTEHHTSCPLICISDRCVFWRVCACVLFFLNISDVTQWCSGKRKCTFVVQSSSTINTASGGRKKHIRMVMMVQQPE